MGTDGVITSIAKMNYDGSVFTNFGEYFINGFDGVIVGNHNYTEFAYWDFKAGHITELCKDYPGKTASDIWCINEGLIAFTMVGSDEENYGAMVDLDGNTVMEPSREVVFFKVGPWIGVTEDNQRYSYYDANGKIVFEKGHLRYYSDGLFYTDCNYVCLDGTYLAITMMQTSIW